MMKRIVILAAMALAVFGPLACGGGGGGGAAAPPAFTNLAGTRWSETDTVSAVNSCEVGIGVTDSFVLHVLAQSGNTISVYDERAGAANAVNATISSYNISFSGSRFAIGGCANMTASYNITLNTAGTAYSGTGTIVCLDDGCSVPVSVSAVRL